MFENLPIKIRPAQPAEARKLAAVAWAAKASLGYSLEQLLSWRDDLTPTARSIREWPTFVAELEDVIAGFCQVNPTTESPRLEHLWVKPKHMHHGVGHALLQAAARHAAQLGIDSLHIDSEPHAEGFYTRCGAVRVGITAAPLAGDPTRVRPQLRLSTSLFL